MKITTTQPSIPALRAAPAAAMPALPTPLFPGGLDARALGAKVVGNIPYQFGLQSGQAAFFQGPGGSDVEAGIRILRVLTKHVAENLPHPRLAAGIVNCLWFSLEVRNQLPAARSPGVSRLGKALIKAGLAAEAAAMVADWFEIRGVDQAAAVVSFIAKHGERSTLGTVQISNEDASAFAEEFVGLGDLAEVRDALKSLASGAN